MLSAPRTPAPPHPAPAARTPRPRSAHCVDEPLTRCQAGVAKFALPVRRRPRPGQARSREHGPRVSPPSATRCRRPSARPLSPAGRQPDRALRGPHPFGHELRWLIRAFDPLTRHDPGSRGFSSDRSASLSAISGVIAPEIADKSPARCPCSTSQPSSPASATGGGGSFVSFCRHSNQN